MLVVISLLACVTLLLWAFCETSVDRFEVLVVKTYLGHYQKRLDHAVSTASKNPKEGMILVEKLLDDLSKIHKLDRLDGVKRKALETIVKFLSNADKNEEALIWAERWAKFDDGDLFAQIWQAKLMGMSLSRLEDGWILISELYRKIPQSSLIANEYAKYLKKYTEHLIIRGKFSDAFLIAYKAFEKQDSLTGQVWQIFWDMGTGFNESQMKNLSPEIDANGNLSILLDVPPGVIRFRIDPPRNSHINLVGPMLIDNKTGQGLGFSLLDVPLGFSQMAKVGRILVTKGGDDPFFYWEMSRIKKSGEKIFFVCTVEEALPEVIVEILRQPDPTLVENTLLERGAFEAAKQFRVLSEKQRILDISASFENSFFEVFWAGPGENFSKERKIRKSIGGSFKEGSYEFKVSFPIVARAEKLRIDFPEIQGKKYRFQTVQLVGSEWTHEIDLNKIDDGLNHMVSHQFSSFDVLGSDPYFVFSSPSREQVIESVVIQGGVL
jgi:hypothetical protein